MGRFFIELSYNGAGFHGWQRQPNGMSVQQAIEEALSTVLRNRIEIIGAGRTDTGVHARQMFAHFDAENMSTDTCGIVRSLNSILGKRIAIHKIIPVSNDAHARFDATSRTYRYYLHHRKDPFIADTSLLIGQLDYEAMNKAVAELLNVRDFTSFAKLHSDAKTNICRVTEARWDKIGDQRYAFTITADRFLRNMVRAVVGTSVEVGRGKISVEEFKEVITKCDRCAAGTSMPAHALFLEEIKYPYIKD